MRKSQKKASRRPPPQPTDLPLVRAFSAGGVIWRRVGTGEGSVVEVVLVGRTDSKGTERELWALPKGTPHTGEAPQATALREVREETGIVPRITGSLGAIGYTFLTSHSRVQKRVRHYLMEPTGGDLALHDHEYDEVGWFPIEVALTMLTHENEALVVQRAADLIATREQRRATPSELAPKAARPARRRQAKPATIPAKMPSRERE